MTKLKPEAVDGDNDGLVQDTTKFERPKGFIVARDGDNYQTIAEAMGAGDDVLAKAQALHDLNYGAVVYPGGLVKTSADA